MFLGTPTAPGGELQSTIDNPKSNHKNRSRTPKSKFLKTFGVAAATIDTRISSPGHQTPEKACSTCVSFRFFAALLAGREAGVVGKMARERPWLP